MQTPGPTGQSSVQGAPAPDSKAAQLKVESRPKVGRSLSKDGRPWSLGRPTAKQIYLARKHGVQGGPSLSKPGKFKVLSHGACPPNPWSRGAYLSDNRLGWGWGEGIQVNSVPEGICEYINWPVYGQQDHWVYVTDDIVELYAEYWGADPHTVWYLGYFEFQPLFPPSPSPSPTPTPEPTPDPTPEPTPSAPPSATPTPPPASPPPPPPPPTPTPEPPYMKMKAQEVLSPNGDGKFDTAQVEIESNVTWELSLDDPKHLIKVGQGNATGDDAVVWDGKGKSGVLLHGEYLLRLHPTKAALDDLYAEVYIDTKGPEATEITFEQGKLDASKNAYAFKGSALLKDVGYSEVDPDTIKVKVDDKVVAHQFDGATGKLTFEGSVSSKAKLKVAISAEDKVANAADQEEEFTLDLDAPVISGVVINPVTKDSVSPDGQAVTVSGTAVIQDVGTGPVDVDSIKVNVAGVLASVSYDAASGAVTYTATVPFTPGNADMQVEIVAADVFGNAAQPFTGVVAGTRPEQAITIIQVKIIEGMNVPPALHTKLQEWLSPIPSASTPPGVPTPAPTSTPSASPSPIYLNFHVPECGPDLPDSKAGYRVALAEAGPGTCGRDLTAEERTEISEAFREHSVELASDVWDAYNSPYIQVGLLFVQPELWAAGKAVVATKAATAFIIAQNAKYGKAAEVAARNALVGVTGEQVFISAARYGLKKNRYLDFVTANSVIEVKNVKYLYASSQLKDIFQYATDRKLQAILITDAKYLTPALEELLAKHKVVVVNIPWWALK